MFCLRFKLSFVNQDSGVFCFSFRWAGSCAEANIHKWINSHLAKVSRVMCEISEPTYIHSCVREKKHPKPVMATSLQSAELICHKTGGTSPGPTWTYTLISSLITVPHSTRVQSVCWQDLPIDNYENSTALCHEKDAVSQSCVTLYLQ